MTCNTKIFGTFVGIRVSKSLFIYLQRNLNISVPQTFSAAFYKSSHEEAMPEIKFLWVQTTNKCVCVAFVWRIQPQRPCAPGLGNHLPYPHWLELLPSQCKMNLAWFIRITAAFVGRWAIFFFGCAPPKLGEPHHPDFPLVPGLGVCCILLNALSSYLHSGALKLT